MFIDNMQDAIPNESNKMTLDSQDQNKITISKKHLQNKLSREYLYMKGKKRAQSKYKMSSKNIFGV